MGASTTWYSVLSSVTSCMVQPLHRQVGYVEAAVGVRPIDGVQFRGEVPVVVKQVSDSLRSPVNADAQRVHVINPQAATAPDAPGVRRCPIEDRLPFALQCRGAQRR